MIMMMHYDVIRHVCVDWQRLVRYGSRVFGMGGVHGAIMVMDETLASQEVRRAWWNHERVRRGHRVGRVTNWARQTDWEDGK